MLWEAIMRSSLLSLMVAAVFAGTITLPGRIAAQNSDAPPSGARQASASADSQPSIPPPGAVADDTPTAASGTGAASLKPLAPDPSNERLREQIQKALGSVPALSKSQLDVQVADSQIELSGSVPTARDKETARRVAQSYGNNRQVIVSNLNAQSQSAKPSR